MIAFLLPAALLAAEVCGVPAPRTRVERLRAAECFVRQQNWQQAEELTRAYLRENPGSERATVLHCQALVNVGHPFDSVLEAEEYLKTHPDSAPVLKVYAALQERVVKDPRYANEILEKLTKLTPEDAEVWRTLGTYYLSQERPDQAVRCYEQAARLAPRDPIAAAGLGAAYAKADRRADSEAQFQHAIRLNESNPEPSSLVYLICAQSLLEDNQPAESAAMATKALMLDPHSAMGYYWRAAAYDRLEDYRHAEADARAALREGGQEYKPVHALLLRIYRGTGNTAGAEREAAEVARLAGGESGEHARAAEIRKLIGEAEPLLRQEKFAEAAALYEQIAAKLPTFYEAYFALGVCYSHTARPAEAEAAFRRFLQLQPLSSDGHAAFGVLLSELTRPSEARRELEEAVRLDSGQTEARRILARLYMAANEYARAAEVLRPAAHSPDADSDFRLAFAEALLRSGDQRGALEEINGVLDTEPANAAALAMKRRALEQR